MPAFVIVETVVTDPDEYERYKEAALPTVKAHGGRYVVRGGELSVLEGDWSPTRLVILEFPDLETARRWYASEEYTTARALREGAATLHIVGVQGLDEPL